MGEDEKKYCNRQWLHEKIVKEGMDYEEVADLTSAKKRTIEKYVHDFNIGEHCCGECEECFPKERGLRMHETMVHDNNSSNNKFTAEKKHEDPSWIQSKLEEGLSQSEIADLCEISYNGLRYHVRENNLGIHYCDIEGCGERYPTEGGLKQHLSKEHPEVDYEGYGLDIPHVRDRREEVRKRKIENGEDQYNPDFMQENLEKAREKFDPDKHSKWMKEHWEELDPDDYHQRRDGWWEKHAESRDTWGPQYRIVEETGHEVASGWEEKIDLMLYESNLAYEYEGKTFSIEDTWNTPDFIGDKWILEVKSPAGYRDEERLDMVGEYLRDEVEEEYIILGEDVDMPCNTFIRWEDREEIVDYLSNL